ncbi:MAG TPA: TMEM175 family protein [Candidatus Limnocylindria bacterium]
MGPEPRDEGLERIVFFSDGVFAIAITLLVIDLRPPEVLAGLSEAAFLEAMSELGPKIVAYLLSFAVIGLYWLAHWRRFHFIVRSNERFAVLNLLVLGAISFIPFPTALIGSQGDRPISVVIYAVTLSAAGLLGTVSWLYARRAGLTREGLSPAYVRSSVARGLSVPVVMLGSLVLLPFIGPYATELSWVLIFVAQAVIVRAFPAGDPFATG